MLLDFTGRRFHKTTAPQRQTAVTAYLKSKQLLLFAFAPSWHFHQRFINIITKHFDFTWNTWRPGQTSRHRGHNPATQGSHVDYQDMAHPLGVRRGGGAFQNILNISKSSLHRSCNICIYHVLILKYHKYFHPLGVALRRGETQLQVGENLIASTSTQRVDSIIIAHSTSSV